ncbi:zinc finger protein 709-like [Musca vetustissima]|uniref:zinc finger protein 709-like n=1 Tax=Musca vetustissima TaxID=27455 RepID=UPI002AB6C09C|nr:zinc finger protein 709-like [Musca vetustissima]
MSQPKRKFCRVCLKEIRSTLSRIYHILEPPEPVIKLRDDRKAATYLQCYYYCIRNGGTDHFNVDSLMDYAYICTKCRLQLMRTLDFIIKSQRNEDFLMSMYEKSTHVVSYSSAEATAEDGDGDDDDLEDELLHGNKTDDNTTIDLEYELFDAHQSRKTEDETQSDGSQGEDEEETDLLEECLDPNDETMRDYQNSVEHSDSELDINEILDELSEEYGGGKTVTAEKEGSKNTVVDFEEVLIETDNAELPPKRANFSSNRKRKTKSNSVKENTLKFKCEICCKVYRLERELHDHYNEHDSKLLKYPCNRCKEYFMSQDSLNIHRDIKHKNKIYEDCEKCGKLICSTLIYEHMEQQHSQDKEYECKTCDRNFLTKLAFVKHQEMIHGPTKLNRFECPDCERFFFTTKNLKNHIKMTHNTKRNGTAATDQDFLCDICSKTFSNKYSLKMHIQRHTGDILKCSYCEKEFVTAKDLRIHIRFHTREFPFKCEQCSQTFAIKTHYDQHRKKHEGVRYRCQVCDKEFGHMFSLRQHSFKHRGYPFSCKLCGKGLPAVFKMRVHLKTRHRKVFNGEYSDEEADQYIIRNNIEKMYPCVEVLPDKIVR